MSATDRALAQYVAEIEERQQFIDGIVDSSNGDISDEKMELITRAKDDIAKANRQMGPLEEARRISGDSADRIAAIAKYMSNEPKKPTEVEYRSAGEYVIDRWRSGLGQADAAERLDMYHRAAAHQKTSDNAGLIPTPILGPVISFIDTNRPLVSQLGAQAAARADLEPAEGHPAHERRLAAVRRWSGRRKSRARQPEDDDHQADRLRRHLRRLRQRLEAGHRLFLARGSWTSSSTTWLRSTRSRPRRPRSRRSTPPRQPGPRSRPAPQPPPA